MKIAVFELEAWEREAFQKLADEHELVLTDRQLSLDNAAEFADAEVLCIFIYSDLGANVLRQFPKLKLITTRSTGFDHIDTDYCRQHNIVISNVPRYGDNTVAEHVFALLLAISHRLPEAIDRTRRGDFSQKNLQGFDLRGKTLGVLGTGHIGRHVCRIAKGFGMEVVAYDVQPDHDFADELGICYATQPQLLISSDVITLHVPYNQKTHHLLSTEQFQIMKQGVVLINTSRGDVIDTRSLLQALASGRVRAAGLDVLSEEPSIREEAELIRTIFSRTHDLDSLLIDHVLLRMRNVIVTPHSAFNTREAVQRIIDTTIDNIQMFANGTPENLVDAQ